MGVVGKATAQTLGITKYIDLKDIEGYEKVSYKQAADYRYIFICLPTPIKNGRYVTDDILEAIRTIKDYKKQNVFIIRSTVYPGFAKWLMKTLDISWVVSNPEFLSADTALKDTQNPDLVIVGAERPGYLKDVAGIYRARHKGVDIFTTDTITAEFAKLAVNGFYATKVVYANQIYDYAKNTRANYDTVRKIMYKRKWIGENHLDIFHKGGRGAGGKCLRKDLEALATYSGLPLVDKVASINQSYLIQTNKS